MLMLTIKYLEPDETTVTAHIERRRSIKLWDFLAPYYGRFRRKIVEKTVIFRRFFAENDQSESPGILIKSGILYARLWYFDADLNRSS